MNLSRLLVLNPEKSFEDAFAEYELCLDLVPEYEAAEVKKVLELKTEDNMLRGLVRKKLAGYILERAEDAESAAALLKDLRFSVSGTRGWNDAQVTRGGVELDEVKEDTMESKLVKGLYFAGEVLDYDGPCGGWNLHYAWQTGLRAGHAMVEALWGAKE